MTAPSDWRLGPFARHAGALLGAQPELTFECPMTRRAIAWAAKEGIADPASVWPDG